MTEVLKVILPLSEKIPEAGIRVFHRSEHYQTQDQ
jgi:hypothetical protein